MVADGQTRDSRGEMATKMILTGDVNLMNVTDPAVPFSLVAEEFREADIVFDPETESVSIVRR